MFAGPSVGGLQAGPTAGALTTNPAAYIPNDGLAITQIDELSGQPQNKHSLLTAATPLEQNLVSGLSSDLAARATMAQLAAGLDTKQNVIVDSQRSQTLSLIWL